MSVPPTEQRGSKQTAQVTDSFGAAGFGWKLAALSATGQHTQGGGSTYGAGSGSFFYVVPSDLPSGATYQMAVYFEDSTGAHIADCTASFATA